jgi:hypothetical protein
MGGVNNNSIMELNIVNQILRQINLLYIMERKKYLSMYVEEGEAKYSTISRSNKYVLVDSIVKRHIRKKQTIGVFAGAYLSKFICFDVDTNKLVRAKSITYKLVDVLMQEYNIPEKYIHVSFSGSKGYHVEIFFDKPISNKHLEKFYNDVCIRLGSLEDGSKVELRPTATQGVKIPLSRHYKTKQECCYVDTITLEPIEDDCHILSIPQINTEDFINLVFNEVEQEKIFYLEPNEAEQVEELIQHTNIQNKTIAEYRDDLEVVLEANRLLRDGTRNNMTFMIAIYLYNEGWGIDDTKARISDLLNNTWHTARHLIDSSTTYEYMLSEVSRITNTVYKYGYILGLTRARIEISKGEMLQIIGLESIRIRKTMYLKQLLFSMLVHSKKFAKNDGSFYMTYSTMTNYGSTDNRSRLSDYIEELQKLGLVEVVQRNKINKALSKECGKIMSEANVYKVTLKESDEKATITLRTDENIDFFEVTTALIPKIEIKKMLTKRVFETTFNKHYQRNI